jgi:hypothetical protein
LFFLTLTNIGSVKKFIIRSIKCWFAFVTVNALRVVTTILANTSAFVESVNVQRKTKTIDIWIVLTLVGMAKAIAS